jgi:MFS superfamily sulfate permease-like transporter
MAYSAEESAIRGLEILRLNGPLFFANALRFRNGVRSLLSGSNPLAIFYAGEGVRVGCAAQVTGAVWLTP